LAALEIHRRRLVFSRRWLSPRQTAPPVCENQCNAFLSLPRSLLFTALAEVLAQAKRLFRMVAAAMNHSPC
jgi:hypothetical protein